MIKVSVLYPNRPGSRFDVDYYLKVHMPMAAKLLAPALTACSAEIGICGETPGSVPTYKAVAQFTCESVEAFLAALMPVADQLQGDIPKYTDIEPIIQIGQINEFQVSHS
jgi:uncharacterized protein (TIGR02118 family)